jgi:uncharacterized protein
MPRGDELNPNRQFPRPRMPWVMAMDWRDLLFMHWRIEVDQLRSFVPPGLEIEIFDGSAWLGVVPFVMSGTRARLLPPVPGLSRFPELNVRTYVRPASGPERDRPGVWFFSLDVTRRAAVQAARALYRLPYFKAEMSARRDESASAGQSDWVIYRHRRLDSNQGIAYGQAREAQCAFLSRYRPVGAVSQARPGTLESFLTDRYRLYAWAGPQTGGAGEGRLISADIHHAPWPLQPAQADVETNTTAEFMGLELASHPDRPVLHFAKYIRVAGWLPRRVKL